MAAAAARVGLEDLLTRFLSGDPTSTVPFLACVRPLILRIARRSSWGLAPDQFEEVVQETMLLLLHQGRRSYAPNRGDAVTFIGLIARRAAREVSALYAPAGTRTRPPSKGHPEALAQFRREARVESLDNLPERATPTTGSFLEAADARLDIALVLDRAPAAVRHGLRRIYLDDISVAQAAAEVGLSRFSLNRMLVKFCTSMAA